MLKTNEIITSFSIDSHEKKLQFTRQSVHRKAFNVIRFENLWGVIASDVMLQRGVGFELIDVYKSL